MKVAIICIIQSFNNFQKSKIYKIDQAKIEVELSKNFLLCWKLRGIIKVWKKYGVMSKEVEWLRYGGKPRPT